MQKLLIAITLINLTFAVDEERKEKTKFTVTGMVIGKNGEGLNKVKLTILNDFGQIVDSGITRKSGEFKFKKIKAGDYRIVGEHKEDGEISVNFTIKRKDVDLKLDYKINRLIENRKLEIPSIAVEIPPIVEFYLKDSKNYESIDKDLKEIIDSEITKIYENVRDELYDLLYYGFNKADPVYKNVFKSFDQDAYVSALLNLKSPTEAEAYWLKQQFIDYDEVPFTNVTIKNKTIKIDKKLESQVPTISKRYPSWAEVIKYYGGYAEVGKTGVNKQNYKSLFTLTHKYYEIKFIEDGKCLIFSKYHGNEKAFEYYKIDRDSIETKKGKYGLTKIDYDIISGNMEPQIIMQFDKLIINQDIFEVAPRAKASLKATLNNYDKIITAMFEDLLTEDYNEKIANIHAEEANKKRLANEKAEQEELNRKVEREKDLQKIFALEEQLKNEYLDSMKTIIQSYKYLEIIKDNSTTERIDIVIETYDRLDSISFEKKEGVEVYIFEDEGDSAIESIQFSKPPKVRRLFQKGITKRGKLKLKGFFKSNFRVVVFDKDSDRYSQIRFHGKTGKNKIIIYFSESGVEWKERKGFFEYTINEENIWNDHKEFLMYESIRKRKIQFSRTMNQKYLIDLLENNVP